MLVPRTRSGSKREAGKKIRDPPPPGDYGAQHSSTRLWLSLLRNCPNAASGIQDKSQMLSPSCSSHLGNNKGHGSCKQENP